MVKVQFRLKGSYSKGKGWFSSCKHIDEIRIQNLRKDFVDSDLYDCARGLHPNIEHLRISEVRIMMQYDQG